jgi:hypothetical protein
MLLTVSNDVTFTRLLDALKNICFLCATIAKLKLLPT